MPRGRFGVPRPLATGSVVLLATVEEFGSVSNSELYDPSILESDLELDGWETDVDLDSSVDTYVIDTGLDFVELDELNDLSDDVQQNMEELLGRDSEIGFSIGFK